MGILYLMLVLTFFLLIFVNLAFAVINLLYWAHNGLQALLHGQGFIDLVYYSKYLKWILLSDVIWFSVALAFAFKRKHYKTDERLYYLQYYPIQNPSMCVVIPAYNEELSIEKVVTDFTNNKYVKSVIVVDNNSLDKTVEIAERCGARVIRKNKNTGFPDSCIVGLKEALKTDANVIGLVEADGTCNAYDLYKMMPYLDNCDMVQGTRQIQTLSEKGNQIKMVYVWGNYVLAKFLQLKFFSLLHMGVVSLTDVGCMYRIIRKESLEKIIDAFTDPCTNKVLPTDEFTLFFTAEAIKADLRIVEIPITFKKRIGISKTRSDKKLTAIMVGFHFLWYILSS